MSFWGVLMTELLPLKEKCIVFCITMSETRLAAWVDSRCSGWPGQLLAALCGCVKHSEEGCQEGTCRNAGGDHRETRAAEMRLPTTACLAVSGLRVLHPWHGAWCEIPRQSISWPKKIFFFLNSLLLWCFCSAQTCRDRVIRVEAFSFSKTNVDQRRHRLLGSAFI